MRLTRAWLFHRVAAPTCTWTTKGKLMCAGILGSRLAPNQRRRSIVRFFLNGRQQFPWILLLAPIETSLLKHDTRRRESAQNVKPINLVPRVFARFARFKMAEARHFEFCKDCKSTDMQDPETFRLVSSQEASQHVSSKVKYEDLNEILLWVR